MAQTYNGRGLPYSVSGSVAGGLVSSAFYNALGSVTEINLGNGLRTTYGYYGTGGGYDTTGGYYGRLWEIKTLPQAGGDPLMEVMHGWDAAGNLVTRQDMLTSETESFTYDFLDRLTGVSGSYASSYEYNQIGNMVSRNGVGYSYNGGKPHAVTSVGGVAYTYDDNDNMTYRGSDNQTITWDAENRPVMVSENGTVVATFIYDGDGNRIEKTEAGETVLYPDSLRLCGTFGINKYYEKNLTSGNVTTSYYLGSRLIAQREGEEVRFIHQDHLSGTSLTTTDNGTVISSIKYFPYGDTRSGDVPTDVKFTGQRLDGTGLYYYGARYYDPVIGRFVSPDPFVTYPDNPQSFNRYAYCLNNPLRYIDPTGYYTQEEVMTVPGLGGVDVEIVEKVIEGAEPSPQNPSQPELPIEDKTDQDSDEFRYDNNDKEQPVYPYDREKILEQAREIELGQILTGAIELTAGILGTIVFGISIIIFAEVPFTLPFSVDMTYLSVQLAIDGWNRINRGKNYIDGNAVPNP